MGDDDATGGSRSSQKVAGTWALLLSGGLLLGHYVADTHSPHEMELWIGGIALFIGLWLWAPVGMMGLFRRARNALPFLEDVQE